MTLALPAVRSRVHLRSLAFWMCTVALVAGWFVTIRPRALGGPAGFVMVRGVSMEPTYHTGDLVVVRARPSYHRGDVIAYRVPEGDVGAGAIVIHRIVGGDGAHGFDMLGDNNPARDDWHPRDADIVGSAWLLVPRAGAILAKTQNPAMAASLAMAVTVAILIVPPDKKNKKDRRRGRYRI
ncbi:MAG: signal peptidase I [Actinomycetota bacterium]